MNTVLDLDLDLDLDEPNSFQIRNKPATRLGIGAPRGTPLIILSIVTGGPFYSIATVIT